MSRAFGGIGMYISDDLMYVAKSVFIATVDLGIGVFISNFVDGLFNPELLVDATAKDNDNYKEDADANKGLPSIGEMLKGYAAGKSNEWRATFWKLAWRVLAQLSLTILSGLAVRRVTFPANLDDPTGGILFILSLFRQKNFWRNVDTAYTYLCWYIGSLYVISTIPS